MKFDDVAIPIDAAWSSPFAKWQGSLADVNSVELAAGVAATGLDRAGINREDLNGVVVGMTIPQKESFYAASTIAAKVGAPHVSGPVISQACATGVATVASAAADVNSTGATIAVITTDRTSNGPIITYPASKSPGGAPTVETYVLESFARDPWGGTAMVDTAEAVAEEEGIGRSELDELTALRGEQYESALANDRAFQKRYMAPITLGGRKPVTIDADEGVRTSTLEQLAGLRPVNPDGVVTFGSQTHPADGAAGMVLTTVAKANEMAGDYGIAKVLAVGSARTDKGRMPKAPVPAATQALAAAGLKFEDLHAVVTHNPFAVNDVFFTRRTGVDAEIMNQKGCSLIYGHPQGPTGTRGIVELLHTLLERGGGIGLFTGCAAGDTGAAVVVSVEA